MLTIREAIRKVVEGQNLAESEAEGVMTEIMEGKATDAQIASFITALRLKGETVEEITGCARIMRQKAIEIHTPSDVTVVDTCGTGGDRSHTFNISTIVAFVAAGAGLVVAKHGNRSVSSSCGSADLCRELGINIEIAPGKVEECLGNIGIGFLFAPLLHGAMKYAIGPRREIGIRTIFNILGPLTNPAGARVQLLGVYDGKLTETLARVLGNLGSQRALVVHGEDGLDEITLTGQTMVSELKDSEVNSYLIDPRKLGLNTCSLEELKGGDVATNARIALSLLQGEDGPRRDVVLLNAAAVMLVSGKVSDWQAGLEMARNTIDSGAAFGKLEQLRDYTKKTS